MIDLYRKSRNAKKHNIRLWQSDDDKNARDAYFAYEALHFRLHVKALSLQSALAVQVIYLPELIRFSEVEGVVKIRTNLFCRTGSTYSASNKLCIVILNLFCRFLLAHFAMFRPILGLVMYAYQSYYTTLLRNLHTSFVNSPLPTFRCSAIPAASRP